MKGIHLHILVAAGLSLVHLPRALALGPRISEFLAENHGGLRDEDGETSDWIEVHNPGASAADLEGWFLTDDSRHVRRWRFPAVGIPPGGYLVVFASGNDRAAPAAPLHANFRLEADGEYLALLSPDGAAASEFTPAFPRQREDISFGTGLEVMVEPLVAVGAPARLLVPRGGGLDLAWTGSPPNEPFDDATWLPVTLGIGYPAGAGNPAHPEPLAYWDFEGSGVDRSGNAHHGNVRGGGYIADTPAVLGSGKSLSLDGVDDSVFVEIDVSETSYTSSLWFKADAGGRGILTVVDQDFGGNGHDRHLYLTGGNIGARVWNNEVITSSGRAFADQRWHHLAHVVGGQVGGQRIYVDGVQVASGAKAASDFDWQQALLIGFSNDAAGTFFDGLIDDVSIWSEALSVDRVRALHAGASPLAIDGFGPFIRTDVSAALKGVNASAYLRIPFAVAPPLDFDALLLRVRYDDGFVAYLNGVEAVRRNAPASVSWNSAAASNRTSGLAVRPETIDLSEAIPLLRQGTNVLAFQALNDAPGGSDFLLEPQLLRARNIEGRYLSPPSPGAENPEGVAGFVADCFFSVDRGLYTAAFDVEVTCPTEGAGIYISTDGSDPSPQNPAARLLPGPIRVSRTTNLRAKAFREGFQPSRTTTHTYIFPLLVASQPAAPAGVPATWSGGFPADYAVDRQVVTSALPGYGFQEALRALPSISISADPRDLLATATGIYANSESRGPAWERPASIELIRPEEGPGEGPEFQADGGIQMHGNSSRYHSFTPKHPIRLLFKARYGPRRLRFPLFPTSPIESFDELLLRGCSTDSWPVVDGGPVLGVQRWAARHAVYIRDQYMRDAQIAMGRISGHGTYVHLYLNGLYWGLYNLAERPGTSFNASHLGGEKEEYDVYKDFAELESGDGAAWNEMITLANAGLATQAAYERIQGRNPNGTRNPAYPVYLDVPNLIDYMILHIASGAEDWPDHNWWGARRRGPESQGFKFFSWDQEISNDSLIRTHTLFQTPFEQPAPTPSPSYLYGRLRANPAFREAFGDRVQALLMDGGLLSPAENQKRWLERQTEIDQAIVGESARWGDSKKVPAYRREVEWLAEMNFMRDEYWPKIRPIALERFRRAGVYPSLEAPIYRVAGVARHGGFVEPGGRLSMLVTSIERRIETPLVTAETDVGALVPADDSLGTAWIPSTYVEGSRGETWKRGKNGVGYEKQSGYETVIGIDVEQEMTVAPANNSVYVRLPFTMASQAAINALEGLTLRMLFDDGFAAFLNGAPIASQNAPTPLAWSSSASAGTEAAIGSPMAFEVADPRARLRVGLNVLAIHGFNFATSSSDMLIRAELSGWRTDTAALPPIRYTTDGSDPKGPGGLAYQGELPLTGSIRVKARSFDGTEWSALSEAWFVLRDAVPLRITEIHYHPAPSPELPFDEEDFEFVELYNPLGEAAPLAGIRLQGGIDYDFTTSAVRELLPRERLLVVRNLEAFRARYGEGLLIAGVYAGGLSNDRDQVVLTGPIGEKLLEVGYRDDWQPSTDGEGHSLTIVDPAGRAEDWGLAASWKPSRIPGGTPGAPDEEGGGAAGWQRPGDSNRDGRLDLSDAIALLFRLFGGAPHPLPCEPGDPAAPGNRTVLDLNGDGRLDMSDPLHLLIHLYRGGPAPTGGERCARVAGCPDACLP